MLPILSFLVTGTAEKVLVDEGQMVKKGQLLAVLNSESYQNMYQVALAKAKQAEPMKLFYIFYFGEVKEKTESHKGV